MKNTHLEQYLASITNGELVTLLDSINDALFIDDESGSTLWLNHACEELFQINREEVIGKSIYQLEDDGVFSPSVARMVLSEKRQCTILHKNKQGKTILSTGIPIFDELTATVKKIITTSRDISELIVIKDELEYNSETIAGFMQHEIAFYDNIIVSSPAMYSVVQLAKQLSNVDSTILITGESGCGKGVIAKLIHESGNRANGPFVHINCGAIPENLIESELFGYEAGAFTGSKKDGKIGLFESANHGIIFLDEISELPLNMQVKLLQVIQDKTIKRIGGLVLTPVDVKIVAATNRNLPDQVDKGAFREDLYYRLNVVPITIPPLRERPEDIIPMARFFLKKHCKKLGVTKTIDQSTMAILIKHTWPGNVRELENIIERLTITTKESTISPDNLPAYLCKVTKSPGEIVVSDHSSLKQSLADVEKQIFQNAIKKYRTTRSLAKALGISQSTAVRRLQKYGMPPLDDES